MMSKIIREIFRDRRDQILKLVGHRNAMTNDEIDRICKALFGRKFRGVSMSNEFDPTHGYHIINTAYGQKSRGIHWVGIVVQDKVIYIFDSYARHYDRLLKRMVENLSKEFDVIDVCNDQYQKRSDICGQLCIAFLSLVDLYGINIAVIL